MLLSLTGCSEQRPSVAEPTVQFNQTKVNSKEDIAPEIADDTTSSSNIPACVFQAVNSSYANVSEGWVTYLNDLGV